MYIKHPYVQDIQAVIQKFYTCIYYSFPQRPGTESKLYFSNHTLKV